MGGEKMTSLVKVDLNRVYVEDMCFEVLPTWTNKKNLHELYKDKAYLEFYLLIIFKVARKVEIICRYNPNHYFIFYDVMIGQIVACPPFS